MGAKIKISGSAILVLVGLGIAYYLYKQTKDKVGGALDTLANEIGGGAYDLLHGDANVAAQQQFTDVRSALAAAGYPPVGSQAYNDIVAQFDPTLVVNQVGGG